jgi:predicted neuraminidase
MEQHIVATRGERPWQGIPSIERASNGRLWCTFFSGGPREPDSENEILITTSTDDGVTWSEPEAIISPAGNTRAYDPCLWHDPAGRLWLFYNLADRNEGFFTLWALVAANSAEADPSWSSPRRIPVDAPFAFRLNKPIVTRDGDWLLPVTHSLAAPDAWFAHDRQLQGVALSSDQGETWTLFGDVAAPAWALENMLVERQDGTIWMLIRTGAGVLWQSFSRDGGRTWDDGTPTTIINPGSRFFLRRLASGRVLLINTPDASQRTTLWAYLSDPDNEMSFQGGLQLDAREKVSYPDAVEAPGGVLYAVHDCDRYGLGEIVLSRFTESEIEG